MSEGGDIKIEPYEGPAGGWGSAQSVGKIILHEQVPVKGPAVLWHQNKPDGFACVSCAWAKPAHHNPFEFCENGAKATAWEITEKRCTPAFFDQHTVTDLLGWSDYALENEGRLTHPMRFDAALDKYVPIPWADAFAEIGRELSHMRSVDPHRVVFYASGRASLEASYMYGLFARLYGNNNLPDSSNMCHETTSVVLPKSIGVSVGTVLHDDFARTDCILCFGHNVGSNAPRMLHDLQHARKRGVPLITFNPLRERGLERFTNPQSPIEMATRSETVISSGYHQVKAGGDIAALAGICKAVLDQDDRAIAEGAARVLDVAFIEEHTHGFAGFETTIRGMSWIDIEAASGLSRRDLEATALIYARSERVIALYGMGLTQHKHAEQNVEMLVNLLLLRGNIGKPGAGICPIRGHSNVQGQRTVGISDNPALVPTQKLKELYNFEPPVRPGLKTVEVCKAILEDRIDGFISLGGNFVRAAPETERLEMHRRNIGLTVEIATKLNRSHLVTGRVAYLLPCLGRIEIDMQRSGAQSVSMEDSTACIHGSRGQTQPASAGLLSEPRIVAELAKATLEPNARVPWDAWVDDYSKVRDAIEATYPEQFTDFNARMFTPGGFARPIAARGRVWNTSTGKANFQPPRTLRADGFDDGVIEPDALRLITLRSNDQFNTTIYGFDDRFRGVAGTRQVLFVNGIDMARLGLVEAQKVTLVSAAGDGIERRVTDLRIIRYAIPSGCVAGYYPELNPLVPLDHHADVSKVPAYKSVPVRLLPQN